MEELNYNKDKLRSILVKENLLNIDQKIIYNIIIKAFNNKINQIVFFVNSFKGYRKTFLFNIILAKVRLDYEIAITVALSEIVALLLEGKRTAYLRFKIPIKLTETLMLNISQQSKLAYLIYIIKLIIWDEVLMVYKFTFEAVDKIFKDIMQINKPFRGIIFVIDGNFRQILPVVI